MQVEDVNDLIIRQSQNNRTLRQNQLLELCDGGKGRQIDEVVADVEVDNGTECTC